MAKRFIETTIWTQNKWFRKLPSKAKLFWFYLISNCDSVGVWEEDLELASFIIGEELKEDELLKSFGKQIKLFDRNKWWVKDFCLFQYGVLKEDNITNRPHQSYISLLKKHSLWIVYTKTIQGDKEKDTDKDMDTDKDKDKDKDKDSFENFWNLYDKKTGMQTCWRKWDKLSLKDQKAAMEFIPKYKIAQPDKQYRKNPETFINQKSWNDEIIGKKPDEGYTPIGKQLCITCGKPTTNIIDKKPACNFLHSIGELK